MSPVSAALYVEALDTRRRLPGIGVCVEPQTIASCRNSLTRGGALGDDRHPRTGPILGTVRIPLAKISRGGRGGWLVWRGSVWWGYRTGAELGFGLVSHKGFRLTGNETVGWDGVIVGQSNLR